MSIVKNNNIGVQNQIQFGLIINVGLFQALGVCVRNIAINIFIGSAGSYR